MCKVLQKANERLYNPIRRHEEESDQIQNDDDRAKETLGHMSRVEEQAKAGEKEEV